MASSRSLTICSRSWSVKAVVVGSRGLDVGDANSARIVLRPAEKLPRRSMLTSPSAETVIERPRTTTGVVLAEPPPPWLRGEPEGDEVAPTPPLPRRIAADDGINSSIPATELLRERPCKGKDGARDNNEDEDADGRSSKLGVLDETDPERERLPKGGGGIACEAELFSGEIADVRDEGFIFLREWFEKM